jgi:hypothetical protein
MLLAELACRRYVISRKMKGSRHCLASLDFARYLRDTRTKRGLSVAEVAEQVGVSIVSVYVWETDRGRPRDANLSALCMF